MHSKFKRLLRSIFFTTAINTGAAQNIKLFSDLLSDRDVSFIVNIGSGNRFLGYEALASHLKKNIISVDLDMGVPVDVIADAHYLPIASCCIDGIICQAVLEHTQDTQRVVSEFSRIIKSGGLVYAEIPFLQGYHAHPNDFRRYTTTGIRRLFGDFREISSGVCVGPSSALSWILQQYIVGSMSGFNKISPTTRRYLFLIASILTFPIKYLDLLFASRSEAHIIAGGLYFLGQSSEKQQHSPQLE